MHIQSPESDLRNVGAWAGCRPKLAFSIDPAVRAYDGREDGEVLLLLTMVGRGRAEGGNGASRGIAEDAVISERGGRGGNSRAVEGNFRIGKHHRAVVLQTDPVSRDHGIVHCKLATRVGFDTGRGIAGEYRPHDGDAVAVAGGDAEGIVERVNVIDRGAVGSRSGDADAGAGVVSEYGIADDELAATGGSRIRNALLLEVGDHEILKNDDRRLRDADAFQPGPRADGSRGARSVDGEPAQPHGPERIVGVGGDIDVEAVCPARQNATERAGAIDGDGFGDGQSTKAAGIETVDLTVDEGF